MSKYLATALLTMVQRLSRSCVFTLQLIDGEV